MTLIEQFKQIQEQKRDRFMRGSFVNCTDKEVRELLTYFIKDVLGYETIDDAKRHLDVKTFKKHKLAGFLIRMFSGSPFRALLVTFPDDEINPFEMKNLPRQLWNTKKMVQKAKTWIRRATKLKESYMMLLTVLNYLVIHHIGAFALQPVIKFLIEEIQYGDKRIKLIERSMGRATMSIV